MTTSLILRGALRRPAALALLCAAAACSDRRQPAPSPLQPPSHPLTTVAHLRGTLDVASGTLTFDPVDGAATGNGVSATIYGDQGVNVVIYNSPVVTSAPVAGKKTYSANVGIQNLLAYRIGDEQRAAAPADTMGIYVFTNTAPVVAGTSSACACTVTVQNPQGTGNFTAPNQPYWFWPEILGPANGGADTTLVRKPWVFQADTQVTRFTFDVLVSAAWVPPYQTVWRVDYPADSLPDTQAEPRWRNLGTPKATESMVGGYLEMDVQRAKDSVMYVRHDSVSSAASAFIEGRFRLDNGGGLSTPQAGLVIDDNTKYIALLVTDSGSSGKARIGFYSKIDSLVTGFTDTVSVSTLRAYQLRKYGADSVVGLVDGIRRIKIAYSALPPTQVPASAPSTFAFGIASSSSKKTTTTWDYVTYQIGQATP